MKKIYFFVAALFSAFTSFAQADLAILHNVQNGDTIKIMSTNPPQYALVFGFTNYGPNALTSTDTLFLATPYQTIKLTLPGTGLPVNDTVFFLDTVGFTSGPATGPGQWCDSIWAKNVNSVVIADPVMSNNKLCSSIYILNLTTSISETFGSTKNGPGVSRMEIYPNPAVNSISFSYEASEPGRATVTITDITGRKVYQEDLGQVYGAKQATINTSSLTQGIYIVELSVNNTKYIGKVVIQK
ncbi:MAG: T9SS type A sorting domain-containing protein [Flavipsychrobacter sp.]|nr:T9SS type A sorting domain-containing protein [Flavipsychrobacter sp.]